MVVSLYLRQWIMITSTIVPNRVDIRARSTYDGIKPQSKFIGLVRYKWNSPISRLRPTTSFI